MTHEQVSNLLARFESAHAVETYTISGVNVWPLIRMFVGLRLVMSGQDPERPNLRAQRAGPPGEHLARRARGLALRALRRMRNEYRAFAAELPRSLRRENRWDLPPGGHAAAIFTVADRALPWGGVWVHSVADPLADALESRGLHATIWELGRSPGPRARAPHSVAELHKHRYNLASKRLPAALSRPAWFEEIDGFLREHGLKIAWHEFEATIRHILVLSEVIETWLAEAGCRIVFLDCWFTAHSLAASLAARRRGIPSVDFQHGVHGEGNVGYSSWVRAPERGYEIMPQYFWVWGEDEAEALLADNHAAIAHPGNVLAGGNLWINRWRRSEDPQIQLHRQRVDALCEGFSRTVLVTLQTPVVPYPAWLADAIRKSPREWRWLIRVHRRDAAELHQIRSDFLAAGHPGLEVEQASSLPLYALLQRAGAHVTGYSSCALEGLAFGVPSFLTHPSADSVYRRYLEQGVMTRCDDADGLIRGIESPPLSSPEQFRRASERAFAPESAAIAAMEQLVALMAPGT